MIEKFNIFTILEKDDKELIHSSFLKYLLEYWGNYFYINLLGKPHCAFCIPELEKSHEKQRFDLEIISSDYSEVIIIENKFKSFPNKKQLDSYDKILKNIHKEKRIEKFLLCFDSDSVSFITKNWKVITYSDLLKVVKDFLKEEIRLNEEERMFITHYASFLNQYFIDYKYNLDHIDTLLEKSSEKDNKFWLRLLYSLIGNKIEQRFIEKGEKLKLTINPGSTSVPLINIIPISWKINGIEKLIQFQGNDVKYYIHTGNKEVVQAQIDKLFIFFDGRNGEFKKLNGRNANSYFIYKEKLTKVLENNINIDMIVDYLMDFYERIDNVIKK